MKACTRRDRCRRWVHHLHRHGRGPVLRQQLDQAAVVQVFLHVEARIWIRPRPDSAQAM
jgi:hypothetical protein